MNKKGRKSRTLFRWGLPLLALMIILSACSSADGEASGKDTATDKIRIVTTIGQIADPISVIGGERVQVTSLMGPGVDPHLYNATQGDIEKLDSADIVLYSGLHLEGNMTEIFEQIGKNRPVLAISEVIEEGQLLHDEGGAVDPHVWFDIDLWKTALEAAVEEMKKFSPEDADLFEQNKVNYFTELDKLKEDSVSKLSEISKEKRVLVTAHDAFGYFGRMYDMEVVGLQGLSTEDEIGLSDIDETIQILLDYQIPAVFVESSVNQSSINAVIEGASSKGLSVKLGGELFSDAMGEQGTTEGTYLGMYQHNVDTIYHALSGKKE